MSSCMFLDDEPIYKYNDCSKCGCNFKLHIAGRSERRSCKYHNFDNDYCKDCGCFTHQVKNEKCLHIYYENKCLYCVIS